MRSIARVIVPVLLLLFATAQAEALIEVTVPDNTIARFGPIQPTSGEGKVAFSTTDSLQFSNGASDTRALWTYTISTSFTPDRNGTTTTGDVRYQGTTTRLSDLVYVSQSSSGAFLPMTVVTATDETGQSLDLLKHLDCGSVTYKGTFSIPYYSNTAAPQTALSRYYQVCDAGTEIYVDTDTDLTNADFAYLKTQLTTTTSGAESYEITIQGTTYVFSSAETSTTVTLKQGRYVPGTATSQSLYQLHRLPDGFPAGALDVTLTTTATSITS